MSIDALTRSQHVWLVAFLTFGVGDVVTTHYGLQAPGVEEENPAARSVLESAGTEGMVGVKLAVFMMAYLAYHFGPREHRAGIPVGLAFVGVVVVLWNLTVVMEAQNVG